MIDRLYQRQQAKRVQKGIAKIERYVKQAQHEASVLGFVHEHDFKVQHELRQALRTARNRLYLWQHSAGYLTDEQLEARLKEIHNAAA